ncbi:MAG: hypothetical protein IPL53_15930 [Ignavibacteria bacterium]|nr:hypothetical protein [Ignavibacteria bacterium]
MIYKLINSENLRFKRAILIYFIIISYLITFSSCMTTESLTVSADKLKSVTSGEITNIKLKNGNSIDCGNKFVEIIKKSDSTVLLSMYTPVHSRENYGSEKNEMIIPVNDILTVQLQNRETDVPMTILLVFGIAVIAGGLIALSVFHSQDK